MFDLSLYDHLWLQGLRSLAILRLSLNLPLSLPLPGHLPLRRLEVLKSVFKTRGQGGGREGRDHLERPVSAGVAVALTYADESGEGRGKRDGHGEEAELRAAAGRAQDAVGPFCPISGRDIYHLQAVQGQLDTTKTLWAEAGWSFDEPQLCAAAAQSGAAGLVAKRHEVSRTLEPMSSLCRLWILIFSRGRR